MTDHHSRLRALLSEPWARGEHGKALLLTDGTLRSWRTLAFGSPHHGDAQQVLGITAQDVATYLEIEPDGAVGIASPQAGTQDAHGLLAQALAADSRLHIKPPSSWAETFG